MVRDVHVKEPVGEPTHCRDAGKRPGFAQNPLLERAQGMPGAWPHPQPRVQMKKAHELVTTGQPKQSGIPRAIGFNGFLRALPGDRAFLPPSLANVGSQT
jgi:hypothetical protein